MSAPRVVPTTPLPWKRQQGHYHHATDIDIDYFIHAANAYPRLVIALKSLIDDLEANGYKPQTHRELLKELGE